MISHRQGIENILSCYFTGKDHEIEHGTYWYNKANQWCIDSAKSLNIPHNTFAAVIAALSPSCPWERNKIDAVNLVMTNGSCKVSTYNVNKEKAIEILRTNDVSILSGSKVTAFYACIMDPVGDDVVVDRHALRIWEGQWIPGSKEESKVKPAHYNRIADCYRDAAAVTGMVPSQMQAATWTIYRNNIGITIE